MMNLKKTKTTKDNKQTNQDKKTIVLTWVAVITLVLVAIGGTSAYLLATRDSETGADISGITGTTDALTFEAGEEVNIEADFDNFAQVKVIYLVRLQPPPD